jgi:hypothetical protein
MNSEHFRPDPPDMLQGTRSQKYSSAVPVQLLDHKWLLSRVWIYSETTGERIKWLGQMA